MADERGSVDTLWAGRAFRIHIELQLVGRWSLPCVLISDRVPFGVACVAGACSSTCANPSTFTPGSPCGQCLLAQEALKGGSPCTVMAALNLCQPDPVCQPYLACALACP